MSVETLFFLASLSLASLSLFLSKKKKSELSLLTEGACLAGAMMSCPGTRRRLTEGTARKALSVAATTKKSGGEGWAPPPSFPPPLPPPPRRHHRHESSALCSRVAAPTSAALARSCCVGFPCLRLFLEKRGSSKESSPASASYSSSAPKSFAALPALYLAPCLRIAFASAPSTSRETPASSPRRVRLASSVADR